MNAPVKAPGKNDDTCEHPILDAINAKIEKDQEDGRRRHLGGSVIGQKCARKIWYGFRWARRVYHKGRMLRLFNRGHREEERFVGWLRSIGVEIYDFAPPEYVLIFDHAHDCHRYFTKDEYNAQALKSDAWEDVTGDPGHEQAAQWAGITIPAPTQIRILDVNGHFGGSLDGIGRYFPGVAQILGLPHDEWGLTEFKTHGYDSWQKLRELGVKVHKPEHWSQMQVYMKKRNLRFGVYMAICKNTDRLWVEFVVADHIAGEGLISKATDIVYAKKPPAKISKSPSWFECKFCDFKDVCHGGEAMDKTCRTCVHATPANDGRWYCGHWRQLIPTEAETAGCGHWQEIRD